MCAHTREGVCFHHAHSSHSSFRLMGTSASSVQELRSGELDERGGYHITCEQNRFWLGLG
jgi:hypothetical protein